MQSFSSGPPVDQRLKCNYNVIMKAKLIRVGNSKGIRIPKSLIEEFNFKDDVELDIQPEGLLIRATQKPRNGWGKAFQLMAQTKDDRMLDREISTLWDQKDWEW